MDKSEKGMHKRTDQPDRKPTYHRPTLKRIQDGIRWVDASAPCNSYPVQ